MTRLIYLCKFDMILAADLLGYKGMVSRQSA